MKLIKVEMYNSLKTAEIIETHYDKEGGWVGLDGTPLCFVCGDVNTFGVLLKDIDDGCMDDVICSICLDKLKNKLDAIRGSAPTAKEVK